MKQKIKNIKIVLVFLGIILNISSTAFVSGEKAPNYPYILEPLPKETLINLAEEFKNLNSNICNPLDEFGFLKSRVCQPSDIVRKEITNENAIIETAKDTIIKNSKFTGVTDKDSLVIERSIGLQGCIKCDGSEGDMKNIQWEIDFKNQIYNGIEIENTQITVVADIEKVYRIDGYWYKYIYMPELELTEKQAKDKLIGKELTYDSDKVADDYSYKITEKDLKGNAEKVILPRKSGTNLELRFAWKIPVGKDSAFWYIYIDAVTGDELKIQQMFQTAGPTVSSEDEDQTIGLNYLYISLGIIILLIIILFFVLRKRKRK